MTSFFCEPLEKKTTGRPPWFNVAAIAKSDTSVSTTNGRFSSVAHTTDSSNPSLIAEKHQEQVEVRGILYLKKVVLPSQKNFSSTFE